LFLGLACDGPSAEDRARAVYAAKDLHFDAAHLWKPAATLDPGETAAHQLAPLLVQQAAGPVQGADEDPFGDIDSRALPTIYYLKSTVVVRGDEMSQWTYLWFYPPSPPERESPLAQGVRVTLGGDGFPVLYEMVRDSSGMRVLFVEVSLEEAAVEQFGTVLPGRRFVIEAALGETPEVVVPAMFEPGSSSLGPFVYLFAGSHDVDTILCRCQPSQVDEIRGNAEYRLLPLTAAEMGRLDPATRSWLQPERDATLEPLLRWPGSPPA